MDKFSPLIEHYGYLVVFIGVMLGCSGIPFPSAAILLAAGVLAQQGHLTFVEAVAFGILGAFTGNLIGYWAGHKGGRTFVLKWGRYVKLTPERLDRVERFFTRHGGRAVFAARFVSVFRMLGALVAGIGRMPWGTFLLYSALGGAAWVTVVVFAGYYFGQGWAETQHWTGRGPLLLALLLAVVVGLYLAYRWVVLDRGA